ncbi:MAG: TetR/AcrR family transcriptional regulator [Alphaproteobacteria bacterium]|nr:TetR/AcrR family transcriptional regulator [Alphaproteobacteria bacterium]
MTVRNETEYELMDGRRNRSRRTRARILDALQGLVDEGVLVPTSEEVARRAGVGHRTVFRHFDDMEGLFEGLHERLDGILRPLLETEPPSGPVGERLAALVELRAGLFERCRNLLRSERLRSLSADSGAPRFRALADIYRENLLRYLPEIESLPPADQSAIEVMLSAEAFELLARGQQLARPEVEAAMVRGVTRMLEREHQTI